MHLAIPSCIHPHTSLSHYPCVPIKPITYACINLRHYACMHHPSIPSSMHLSYLISGLHILIHPITHVHPPIHSIMHARTSLNHCALTHPPMCVPTYPIHPITHACMPAPVQTIRGVFPPIPFGMYTPFHHITHACTHPSDHTCMHAIIQAVLICAPAAPDTRMLTVNAEPGPPSSALYPAALEHTKISPPEKPGFKLSCSRPQTTLLLENHKPSPFQRPLHCLHGKRRMKTIDPVSTFWAE